MSFSRPKANETEEDLLEFQRKFLESGQKPAVEVIRKRKSDVAPQTEHDVVSDFEKAEDTMEEDVELQKKSKLDDSTARIGSHDVEMEMENKDSHITAVLSKITERDTGKAKISFPSLRSHAFPPVHHRLGAKFEQKGKSIFAREFKKYSNEGFGPPSKDSETVEKTTINACGFQPLPETIPMQRLKKLYPSSTVVSGTGLSSLDQSDEMKKIHEENLEKLSTMSESEALAERDKLLQELNPEIIEFLRKRSKISEPLELKKQSQIKRESEQAKPYEVPEDMFPSTSYLHMDVVEAEKLAWTEHIPNTDLKEMKSSLRFNFNGDVVKDGQDIPTHLGLHHHGEDPHLAGYTLQELFVLSRSKFTQQRVLAITLLGKIVTKAKSGDFISIAPEGILGSLLKAGLIFLLRWSLDEQSETLLKSSIFCLHALLCNPHNEVTLNWMFASDRGCEFPSLSPGVKIKADENDHEAVEKDIVAGLVRMKILPRLRYILEVVNPDASMVGQCLDILMQICRHSIQSAIAVYECPRLIRFIIHSLILNADECQFPQSVALLRTVCIAGKHVSSRLLKDHPDVNTIIYKNVGSSTGSKSSTNLDVEIEAWRLCVVLCSYGLLEDTFRSLQYVTAQLSKVRSATDDDPVVLAKLSRGHLICKLCATAIFSPRNLSVTEWQEISDQVEIICYSIKEVLYQSETNSKIMLELKLMYSTGLGYITHYCNHLRSRSDLDIKFRTCYATKILTTTLNRAFEYLSTVNYPQSIRLSKGEEISALPRIYALFPQESVCDYIFLSSYLQCCVALLSLDKSTCQKFLETVVYLVKKCQWLLEIGPVSCFLLRDRVYSNYWSAQLYLKLITYDPPRYATYGSFFFKLAFKCFGQLSEGDEHMMHHVLSSALFHPDLLKSLSNASSQVVNEMASLDMSKVLSTIAPLPSTIMDSVITTLPSIRATYLQSLTIDSKTLEKSKIRYFHKVQDVSSYLLPANQGTCATSDWPFIPLLQLYNYSLGRSLPAGCVTHTVNCLRYLCFLEHHCKHILDQVSLPAKLVRIMCVFIAGNDLFLEHPIKECLAFLFSYYCKTNEKEDLDFTKQIPGISSFFDFFLSLLEQYASVSFGDELFAAVVLLPLHQCNGGIPDVKKTLWCDHVDILRLMGLPISKLLIPLSWYLYPTESDVFIIRAYLRALASGNCTQVRCPILYTIAIHHTAGFLFDKTIDTTVALRRKIYKGVLKLKDDHVRQHILQYDKPLSDDLAVNIGFSFMKEMDETRKKDISYLGG